jgi:hypothetical protein
MDVTARGRVGRMRDRAAIVAICAATAAALLAVPGIAQPYTYDESVTVGAFIQAESPLDAATEQIVANNHMGMSVVGYLVAAVTGSTSEVLLRLLPTMSFCAAAAVFAWWTCRRLGLLAAISAAALFVTNPLVFSVTRQVRGYSFLILCAMVSTILLEQAVASKDRPNARSVAQYIAIAAAGVVAQLSMIVVLVAQLASLWAGSRGRGSARPLWPVWAGLIGVAVQLPLLTATLAAGRGRLFRDTFPVELAEALLGGSVVTAALGMALIVAGGTEWVRRPPIVAAGASVMLTAAGVWLVAPVDLYTRLFVGVAPAIALGIALGVRRCASTGGLAAALSWLAVLVIVVSQLITIVPTVRRTDLANRSAATVLRAAQSEGLHGCVLATSSEALMGYAQPQVAATADDLDRCDLVISLVPHWDEPAFPGLNERFPYTLPLDTAASPGTAYSRRPVCSDGCRSGGEP